ncbi:type IV pilus biogenesis/stability protein PilW [Rhodoferax mekongensis]|uniref:Type IV pilus biogenesis/stability protein PilW n=1 Tax=Rhodoferax mekongensis TaxID=3068341 RepID=A0ABZ0AXN4_9BURK|nr:type IV pilus biogenesis/stability protein PilW [Rhodoferax sp. TBRC 17307]WNO03499.1 type IV pilus biogenesis/stability protein PilW [Rhodoferax sp. TBRC 17307]
MTDGFSALTLALRPFGRAVVSMIFLALAIGLLQGCAGGAQTPASTNDLLTDSDESPARKRAKIRLELAAGYYNNGQTTVALDELKQSISADPGLFEAHNLRGLIYMRLNDFPLAEESFKRALQLNPQAASVQHNYGWLLCQQGRAQDSYTQFMGAIANPNYNERSKSWMAMGVCQVKAGARNDAIASLTRANELDPSNPVAGYNLALLLMQRGDLAKAQFHVRRINNSEYANAESLWLGIKIEQMLGNKDAMTQLGAQLRKRFGQSKEAGSFDRGAFDE